MGNGLIIPCHRGGANTEGGTQEGKSSRRWNTWSKPVGGGSRQIRDLENAER